MAPKGPELKFNIIISDEQALLRRLYSIVSTKMDDLVLRLVLIAAVLLAVNDVLLIIAFKALLH